MSGHSKWSNIKHRKGAQDKKKAKLFTKAIREITIAVKENGLNGDIDTNPSLRNAVQNARGINMPKDTIQRAIKKATGEDGTNYEKNSFEGYGPHGIALFLDCTTDNNNRTVADVRSIFNKYGGELGKNGSVEFLFEQKGVFTIKKENLEMDWEELQLELIEKGASSFEKEKEIYTIYSDFNDFGNVSHALEELEIETMNASVQHLPLNTTTLEVNQAATILKMIDAFEDNDDVQDVFHTMEITEEVMALMEEE